MAHDFGQRHIREGSKAILMVHYQEIIGKILLFSGRAAAFG
jgi:hypothetical protein